MLLGVRLHFLRCFSTARGHKVSHIVLACVSRKVINVHRAARYMNDITGRAFGDFNGHSAPSQGLIVCGTYHVLNRVTGLKNNIDKEIRFNRINTCDAVDERSKEGEDIAFVDRSMLATEVKGDYRVLGGGCAINSLGILLLARLALLLVVVAYNIFFLLSLFNLSYQSLVVICIFRTLKGTLTLCF